MAEILVNGIAYDYTQITVLYSGVELPSMSAISYTETQEKVNNFGTGNRVVSIGKGPIETDGSMELSQNDIEALRNAAPNRSLLELPSTDIILVFGNAQAVVTHIIKNMEFTNDGNTGTVGDTDLKMTLTFNFSHVQYIGT